MMGHRQVEQAALFYEFSLEKHIPADQLLRSIDRFVDLQEIRRDLAPSYSSIGRPSIDPVLISRMLLIGYCFGLRSERCLCDEVHLNLAYRWFSGGDGFAVDASLIKADANRQRVSNATRDFHRKPLAERSMSIWLSSMMPCSERPR
jgi:transposase